MSDLVRLRAVETWLAAQLDAVREDIDALTRPRWWVQWTRRRAGEQKRGVLHREGCWRPGEPDLNVAQAQEMLAAHPDRIERCEVCRAEVPDATGA